MKRVLWFVLGGLSVIGAAYVAVQMDEAKEPNPQRSPHWDWPNAPEAHEGKQTNTAPPTDAGSSEPAETIETKIENSTQNIGKESNG